MEVVLKKYIDSMWTNTDDGEDYEGWHIKWDDVDNIIIEGPYHQKCTMCGGDFESFLSGLCNVYEHGKRKGLVDVKEQAS